MSDTVKLVVEIPKYDYEEVGHIVADGIFDYNGVTATVYKAIANGVPLDDVKAEIAEEYANTHHMYPDYASGLSHAYEIIDKHISGKE